MYKFARQKSSEFCLLFFFALCMFVSSCISVKKTIYFNDLSDTMNAPITSPGAKYQDPKIESNDILAITVQTVTQNPGNAPITSNSTATFSPLNGFLVDKNGYIELPLMGFVKVAGLTTSETRELIKQKAKEFYNNPVVNVKIANFDIVVLGDVGKPGTITSPSEKISILDAIALSGDMNITARRDNVLLTRTIGDDKIFVRLDLNSSKIYQSPFYYLKQRDQIYITPNKGKVQSSDNTLIRNLGILSSFLSIVEIAFLLSHYK